MRSSSAPHPAPARAPARAPAPSGLPRRPCSGPGARLLGALLLAALVLALAPEGPARADDARWRWPVPPPHTVVAEFRAPEHRYGPGHRGIDIAVPAEGAPVRAVEAGTVRFSGDVAGRGVVSVLHADGLISTYEPVHGLVAAGSRVEAGEVLGTLEPGSAASHCEGGGCLHLGARSGGDYLDPLPLLGARGPSVLLPWQGPRGDGGPPPPAGQRVPTGQGSPAGPGAPAGTDLSPGATARAMGAALVGVAAAAGTQGAGAAGS